MSSSIGNTGAGVAPGSAARTGKCAPVGYDELREHEHHFNKLEMEVRKLASAWLLAALGAIAYFVSGQYLKDGGRPLVGVMPLIATIGAMGNLGLFVLSILDHLVYHRLLQAAFIQGLRMEYLDPTLPPVRSLMMLSSGGKGVSWLSRQYYFGSTAVLAVIAVIAAVWYVLGCPGIAACIPVLLVGLLAFGVPIMIHILGAEKKTLKELAGKYGDPAFTEIVSDGTFESIVQKYHP